MKKQLLYVFLGAAGLILGAAGAFTSLKLVLAFAAGIFLVAFVLADFERSIILLALYSFIDFGVRQITSLQALASYWDELFFIFTLGLLLVKWLLKKDKKPYKWTPMDFPVLLFLGINIFLLIVNTPELSIGLEGLRAVVQYALWFFITVQLLKTADGAGKVLLALVLTGTFMGLHGIYQYIIRVPIPANWIDTAEAGVRTRVFSIVTSPNILGSVMVLIIPISLSMAAIQKAALRKAAFYAAAMIMAAALVFTYSRMALFALLVSLGIYFLMWDKRFVFALMLAFALLILFVPSVGNRIGYMLSPEYLVSALQGGRLVRWQVGLRILKENLLFGVGLGRFGGAVAANNNIPGTFYMDNYFLKIAVEMGLTGLIAFTALVLSSLFWGFKTVKVVRDRAQKLLLQGVVAGMCGVVAHNLVENVFEVPMMTTYFWMLAGIVMFYWYLNKEEKAAVALR